MKARVFAPVNVALIKYWGKSDEKLRIPVNSNLSVCLEKLGTETTVEFKKHLKKDKVVINKKKVSGREKNRVVKHLDRVRKMADIDWKVEVISENNFPTGVGLSSSASGMAALSLGATKAAGLDLSEKDLSRLARLGSGSACRSMADGWVEWVKGDSDKNSYAKSVFSKDHWDLRILVVVLSQKKKKISSSRGMAEAKTSEFFKTRIKGMENKLIKIKQAIKDKNFSLVGEIMENEALNMHAVMLTQRPSLIYWLPETVMVMQAVQGWRSKDLESYFTVNTGQNVLVICEAKNEEKLVKKLKSINGVIEVRKDRIGKGARLLT